MEKDVGLQATSCEHLVQACPEVVAALRAAGITMPL